MLYAIQTSHMIETEDGFVPSFVSEVNFDHMIVSNCTEEWFPQYGKLFDTKVDAENFIIEYGIEYGTGYGMMDPKIVEYDLNIELDKYS